jgi:UDP-N-acetylmuramyl-tripeptide synthetase
MEIFYRLKQLVKNILPSSLLDYYHYLLALASVFLYGFPSGRIKVIGVTGTSGKSTVVEMISRILEEAGYKTAAISSIKFKIGSREKENKLKMTMPGRMRIQRFLRQAVRAGCQYFVLEVTSEGIKQHRQAFIDFEAAVLTNLNPEHIESHQGFENYRKAKGELFKAAEKIHIVNLDDKSAEYFLRFPARQKYLYKIKNQTLPAYRAGSPAGRQESKIKIIPNKLLRNYIGHIELIEVENYQVFSNGTEFAIDDTKFHLSLLGVFNIYNALAAISVGLSQGINLEICQKALEKVKGIPGRMEVVIKEPFTVIVDYAHTPDSLKKVYQTIKDSKLKIKNSKLKLICVLGACGGGRDKWKRPVLGRIAADCCDKIIITNEDPYDEDPDQILSRIKSGVFKTQFPIADFYEILDRRKAIRRSLELAEPGDIVIITGKGCEPWMCLKGGKKIPWDDRQIVREEFKYLKK